MNYLFNPAHWSGADGIPTLIGEHLLYSLIALAIAAIIAVPLGIYIGVTGKGVFMIAGLANALRALPSVGLLILLVLLISPAFPSRMGYVLPSLIVLVLLAVPPILTNTYAGVRAVDAAAVDFSLFGKTSKTAVCRDHDVAGRTFRHAFLDRTGGAEFVFHRIAGAMLVPLEQVAHDRLDRPRAEHHDFRRACRQNAQQGHRRRHEQFPHVTPRQCERK